MAKPVKPKLIRVVTFPISFRYLLRGQLRFMADSFDLLAVSAPGPELRETEADERVRTQELLLTRKITPFQDLIALVRMMTLFWRERPDIVHSHTPKAGLIAMLAAWIVRVPNRVHTVAGMPLMVTSGIKRQVLLLTERLTYACATHVIPNSHGLREYIVSEKLVWPKKIRFFEPGSSNGIDLAHYHRVPAIQSEGDSLRESLLIQSRFVFLFAGRIVRDKGVEEMVAAFIRLYAENPRVAWVVAGDFDHGLNQISETTRHILESHPAIYLIGFVKDIRTALAACDVLVLPSFREGLPQVLLQACAMDRPCITTDIMGCNEVVHPEENGLIVQPQDAESLYNSMKRMTDDPLLVERLSQNARHSIDGYDQQKLWAQVLGFYRSLIGQ